MEAATSTHKSTPLCVGLAESAETPAGSPPTALTTLGVARFLAGRTDYVRYHTGDNEFDRTGPWPTTEPDEPWIIMLQDGHGQFATLMFDMDDKHGDALPDTAQIAELLDRTGIEYLVERSGPGRRFHLDAPFRPGVPHELVRSVAEHLRPLFPALDTSQMTNRSSAATRPPGSPHRLGGRSRLLDDHDQVWHAMAHRNRPEALLRLLTALGGDAAPFEYLIAGPKEPAAVSQKISAMLRTGVKDEGDTSPSGVVRSVLVALVNARVDRSTARQMVLDPGNALLPHVTKGARRHKCTAGEYFDFEWDSAVKYCQTWPAISGPNDARLAIAGMRTLADGRRWKGRTGSTDRVVLEAHWAVASRCGNLRHRLGVREIAELTGFSHGRITGSWKRLLAAGWLERLANAPRYESVEKRVRVRASMWRLRFSLSDHTNTRPPEGDAEWSGNEKTIGDTFHDAFVNVPNSVRRVWAQLSTTEPVRPAQLVEATGMASATIYRAKDKLVDLGLAIWENGALRAVAHVDLEAVADRRGTLGHRDELHARYADERSHYEARLNGEESWPYEMVAVDEETGEMVVIRLDPDRVRNELEVIKTGVTLTVAAA